MEFEKDYFLMAAERPKNWGDSNNAFLKTKMYVVKYFLPHTLNSKNSKQHPQYLMQHLPH